MILDKAETSGARFLLVAAALVVVVAGLKLGAPILLPFALALFLAIMSLPITFWLQRHIPPWLSIVVTVLITVSVFTILVLLAIQSLSELGPRLPGYRQAYSNMTTNAVAWVTNKSWYQEWFSGLGLERVFALEQLQAGDIFDFLAATARQAGSLLSSTFLIFLMMIFMLSEATVFPFKLRSILGQRAGSGRRMTKIIREVQVYLGIKTVVSLITGLLIGVWAWLLDLDFPVLLGLIGFVLNYVPTIGSILAVVPALFLSAVQFVSVGHAILVLAGYVFINMVFGNIIEPTFMGRRLGLSTLVVILSLIFWAWLWGPIGAILAVPLTMVVKIMLENTQDLRWAAVLLDKSPPQSRMAMADGASPPTEPVRETSEGASPELAKPEGEAGVA